MGAISFCGVILHLRLYALLVRGVCGARDACYVCDAHDACYVCDAHDAF